jgi:hypothetical protein
MAGSHVGAESNDNILDIGSGLGTNRRLFPKAATLGADINLECDGFRLMNAGRLDFPEASFDHTISIAVCHHLGDETRARHYETVVVQMAVENGIDPFGRRDTL